MSSVRFFPDLETYVSSILPKLNGIPANRRNILQAAAAFVRHRLQAGEAGKLIFICTHNSRRSQLGQVWAATAAWYFGLEAVETYSGGTEVTAFNPRAVAALRRAGFRIDEADGENPHYRVRMADTAPVQECFSKRFDDPFNPRSGFAAIMTCSEADQNCPLVPGAAFRLALPYADPKEADGTSEETLRYDERCRQIAQEIFFLFGSVAGLDLR